MEATSDENRSRLSIQQTVVAAPSNHRVHVMSTELQLVSRMTIMESKAHYSYHCNFLY